MWGTLVPILGAISDPLINHVHLDPEWQYAGIAPIFAGLFLIRKCSQLYVPRLQPFATLNLKSGCEHCCAALRLIDALLTLLTRKCSCEQQPLWNQAWLHCTVCRLLHRYKHC